MRLRAKSLLQGSPSATRSFLSSARSKLTDISFLTLLIAVGTLATAFVAYRTALDSHEQVQLLKRQVELNSMETRPFLRLKSSVQLEKPTRVLFQVINLGRIPARVVAYDMVLQVGRKVIEPKGSTFNTQDILYPEQPGLGVFRTLSEVDASFFGKSAQPIVIGGCLIYGSITSEDTRRWKVSAAYRFDSPGELPIGLFAKEVGVPAQTDMCDASSLRDEWASQMKTFSQ